MSNAIRLERVASQPLTASAANGNLLATLLQEQHRTAVHQFSQWHTRETAPLQARYYRDLIPPKSPAVDEQYAFEVDLDACSGCKACVVACHNLNGLEAEETWRSAGLLHGGTTSSPVLQHVTTACHHCLAPPCLEGCPVNAYEKDPVTGIVRHLDDQCIGCQYCILKCPYDVPKYSQAKGIVRKCDMCSARLAAGEAPACVQACPNQAIRIRVISKHEVAENAEANLFLPGAPEPAYTLPSTIYKTRKPLPANLLPADYYSATPQHAHWPLVLMLVLTQMSVGAFLVEQVLGGIALATSTDEAIAFRTLRLSTAFILGMIGLAASVFHLGRPGLAYRAIIGWKTSWLSREVLAFTGFALSASLYAAIPWLEVLGATFSPLFEAAVGALVALTGLTGVVCSTMIYASTRRAFWNPAYTGLKFLLSCLVLGIPVALLIHAVAALWTSSSTAILTLQQTRHDLCGGLLIIVAVKLLAEAGILGWLNAKTFTPLRRTALLLTHDLARVTIARFAVGVLGGFLLPAWMMFRFSTDAALLEHPLAVMAIVMLMLILSFAGELLERYLFFAAVVAPKMPGAPTA